MTNRNYIGLACTGHDNALAIVNSQGEVVFAEATERYLQNKRAISALPDDLVRIGKLMNTYCDKGADIVIAKSWSNSALDVLGSEYEEMGAVCVHTRKPKDYTSIAIHSGAIAGLSAYPRFLQGER